MATLKDYTQDISQKLTQMMGHVWSGEHVSTPRQPNLYEYGVYTLAKIHRLVHNLENTHGTPSQKSLMDYLLYATHISTLYAIARGQPPNPKIRSHTNSTPQAQLTLEARITSPRPLRLIQQIVTRLRSGLQQNNQNKPPSPTPQQNQRTEQLLIFCQTQLFTPAKTRVQAQPTPKHNTRPVTKLHQAENYWTYGDRMATKNLNIIRLYSHNINGLPVDNIFGSGNKNLGIMKDRRADVMGWSKTNVEWNSYPLCLATHRVFKQVFP